jgi:hypothetical protein
MGFDEDDDECVFCDSGDIFECSDGPSCQAMFYRIASHIQSSAAPITLEHIQEACQVNRTTLDQMIQRAMRLEFVRITADWRYISGRRRVV